MRLVQEQGGAVDADEEHVEIVVVEMLVTVMVDGGATLGQVDGGVVEVGGQLVGEREMVTVGHDVEGGVVGLVGAVVAMQEHALDNLEVEARQGLAKAGMLGLATGCGRKVLQNADAELM